MICLLCLVLLAGCGRSENPYRVDTVVQIPVNPTEETLPEITVPAEPEPTERPPAPTVGNSETTAFEPVQPVPAATEITIPQMAVPEPTAPFLPDESFGADILAALNGCRAEAGVGALIISDALGDIAAERAEEAATLWAAHRPDGREGVTILDDHGWTHTDAAQLLLHINGPDEPSAIAARWAGSAGVLKENFTVAGVGFHTAGGTTYICCLMTD